MSTEYNLMVAPNGARLQKSGHPAVPITKDEIVETVVACGRAGANAIHIHVRDKDGQHSLDADRYRETAKAIANRSDITIQISTEAAGIFDTDTQRECLTNCPTKYASIALREIMRDPEMLRTTYAIGHAQGIRMQHILYSADDIHMLQECYDNGSIDPTSNDVLFVLGRYTEGQVSSPKDLQPFLLAMADTKLNWSVCAFGQQEHECLLAALQQGGNVRLGFENNHIRSDGTPYADNIESLETFIEHASKFGFTPKRSTP